MIILKRFGYPLFGLKLFGMLPNPLPNSKLIEIIIIILSVTLTIWILINPKRREFVIRLIYGRLK